MNVLVLGALGFIGKNLVENLLNKNSYTISTYDRAKNDDWDKLSIFQWVGDFTAESRWDEILKDVDVCFHLISTSLPGRSNYDVESDISGNLISTIRLLDSMKHKKIKIIYASSGGTVYGNSNKAVLTEEDETNPIVSYGITKLAIEKYMYMYHVLYGLNVHIFRIANPYGVGQNLASGQGAIPIFVDIILNNREISIWGDGSIIRDYIYISDLLTAFDCSISSQCEYLLLNIGSGKGYSLLEVITVIEEVLNLKANVKFLPSRAFDVQRNVLSVSKAKNMIGWTPNVSLVDGVSLFLKSIRCI